MKLFKKTTIALCAITLLLCNAQAFGMKTAWKKFKQKLFNHRDSISHVEGSQEGIQAEENDGPPAQFNFVRAQQNFSHYDVGMIIPYQSVLLSTCQLIASRPYTQEQLAQAKKDLHKLLSVYISPNIQDIDRDRTPLHFVAEKAQAIAIAKMLIKWGAQVNAKDTHDSTPVHYATYTGNIPGTLMLLEAKGDLNSKNKYGKTALDYAQKHPALYAELQRVNGAGLEGQPQQKDAEESKRN
jgi:hypothetical protein